MSKQIDLDKYTEQQQLEAVASYIIARERNAFPSRGLQYPYITDEQLLNKFKVEGGLARLEEITSEFYEKRLIKSRESKLIRRLQEEIKKHSNPDVIEGIQMCIKIVQMDRELLNF